MTAEKFLIGGRPTTSSKRRAWQSPQQHRMASELMNDQSCGRRGIAGAGAQLPRSIDAESDLGAALRGPHDSPSLKLTESPLPVGRRPFVADGITQAAPLPADAGPLLADGPMHLMGFRFRRPIDGAALEVVESPVTVRGA